MNRNSRITIDSKANASRKITRTSNGGIAGPLQVPSLGAFPPLKLKRGDSICEKFSFTVCEEQAKDPFTVTSVDDTPQSHPSHVPTPATLEGLCRDDVREVIFDTIPTTFENLFSYDSSQESSTTCLGGRFWKESIPVPSRRNNSESNLPISAKPVTIRMRSASAAVRASSTALQRQWEVENTYNLHQAISSRRLLDKDPLSEKGWSLIMERNE
jgi:hypothetical protein